MTEDEKIIVICEQCHQKLRIPRRSKKLHVTCPTCQYEFDYLDGDEFQLRTPTEVKGLIISLIMIVAGRILPPLLDVLPTHSLPDIVIFLFILMTPAGVLLLIVFVITTLIAGDDITRFLSVKRIVISSQGIALYKKDDSTDQIIYWRQIKRMQSRGLKHMFLGRIETRREPIAVILNLIDDSKFVIPLHLILKEQDSLRMISTLERYVHFS
jgi:hypothetical protein